MRRRVMRLSRGLWDSRGLTLLELVVAVLAIGSLAALQAVDQSRRSIGGAMPRLLAQLVALEGKCGERDDQVKELRGQIAEAQQSLSVSPSMQRLREADLKSSAALWRSFAKQRGPGRLAGPVDLLSEWCSTIYARYGGGDTGQRHFGQNNRPSEIRTPQGKNSGNIS